MPRQSRRLSRCDRTATEPRNHPGEPRVRRPANGAHPVGPTPWYRWYGVRLQQSSKTFSAPCLDRARLAELGGCCARFDDSTLTKQGMFDPRTRPGGLKTKREVGRQWALDCCKIHAIKVVFESSRIWGSRRGLM